MDTGGFHIPEPKGSFKIKESDHRKTFHHSQPNWAKHQIKLYNIWLIKISKESKVKVSFNKAGAKMIQKRGSPAPSHQSPSASMPQCLASQRFNSESILMTISAAPLGVNCLSTKGREKRRKNTHMYKSGTHSYDDTHKKHQIKKWMRMKVAKLASK